MASPTDLIKTQIQIEGRRRLMGKPPRVEGMTDAFDKLISDNFYNIDIMQENP